MTSLFIKIMDINSRIKTLEQEIKNLKEQPDTYWRYGEKEAAIKRNSDRISKHKSNKLKALESLEKAIQKERETLNKQ